MKLYLNKQQLEYAQVAQSEARTREVVCTTFRKFPEESGKEVEIETK